MGRDPENSPTSYEYEDLVGGSAPPANPTDLNPLERTLLLLKSMTQPAAQPAAVVGDAIATPPPVQTPDRLASEGLAVGAGQTPAPSGNERPAEYPAQTTPQMTEALSEPDPYAIPGAADSVDAATRMLNERYAKVAESRGAYMRKKQEAEASHLTALAVAAEDDAQERALLNVKHERWNEMNNARADAETASMLNNLTMLAKQEPNPARWWENQSGLGKALWALSLVFGSAYSAMTPGAKNAALEMVRQEVANDVALQDARLKREMAVGELKYATAKEKAARNRSDAMTKYEREITRIQAMRRAWDARAVAPNDLDAQAAKLESQAWFDQMTLPVVAQYREELVQARTRAEQMQFQRGMQAASQSFQDAQRRATETFQAGQKALDRQQAYDLAQLSISAKGAKVNAAGEPVDENGIPVLRKALSGVESGKTSGAVLVGPDNQPVGGSGVVRFRKEDGERFEKFGKITTGANEQYQTLNRLYELLGDQGRVSAIAAGTIDAEVTRLIVKLGTSGAKEDDPGGRYTDKDFSRGVIGAAGFDPNGKLLDRLKFANDLAGVRENIRKMRDQLPGRVNQHLTPLIDADLNGGPGVHVVWHPVDLDAPTVQERSENQVTGTPNVSLTDRPVKGESDYLARRSKEAGDPARRGQELPEHEHDKVEAVMDAAKGRSPDAVTKEAQRVLRDLDSRATKIKGDYLPGLGGKDLTHDEEQELRRINATRDIVKSVAFDEVQKARETLDKFEKWVKGTPFLNKDHARGQAAKRFGLTGAPREVDEILDRYKGKD